MTTFDTEAHPRSTDGTFAVKEQSAPDVGLAGTSAPMDYSDEQINGSYANRAALVADLAINSWTDEDSLPDQEKLNRVLGDLTLWSDWAINKEEFGWVPRIDKNFMAVDIITAEQTSRRRVAEEAENGDDVFNPEPVTREEVGSEYATATPVPAPTFSGRSARNRHLRARITRAHEGLSRWNVRQSPIDFDEDALSDALADCQHWATARGVSFGTAMTDALQELEDLTGR